MTSRRHLGFASRSAVAIAISAFLVLASAPSMGADDQTNGSDDGSMYRRNQAPITARDLATGAMRKRLAECVYGFEREAVDRYLVSDDYEGGWAQLARARPGKTAGSTSVLTQCMGRQGGSGDVHTSIGLPTFRVMMAEEAYLARHDSVPESTADAVEVLARAPLTISEDFGASAYLAAAADCMIYRDANGADALLRTVPDSQEERLAAQALAPAFGACLPEDRTVRITAQILRALAAEGLWARYARVEV